MKKEIIGTFIYAAVGFIIPFVVEIFISLGDMLMLTQITVMLCGFMLGARCGMACGVLVALMRHFVLWMPYDNGAAFAFGSELCIMGLMSGFLFYVLPKRAASLYVAVMVAILSGAAAWLTVTYFTLTDAVTFPVGENVWRGVRLIPGAMLAGAIIPPIVLTVKFKKIRG